MNDFDVLKKERPCKECRQVRIIVGDGLCSKCYYEPLEKKRKCDAKDMAICYHGTTKENAEKILLEGFKLDTKLNRDPGDWGRGIYFYPEQKSAKGLDETVLKAEIDISNYFKISNEEINTIRSQLIEEIGSPVKDTFQRRIKIAWLWRKYFLDKGYKGLLVKGWDSFGYEIIVFDIDTIKTVDGKQSFMTEAVELIPRGHPLERMHSKVVTARKLWRCSRCTNTIEIREKYILVVQGGFGLKHARGFYPSDNVVGRYHSDCYDKEYSKAERLRLEGII